MRRATWWLAIYLALAAAGCDACRQLTCCKVCRDGKACGDTCIARGETCNQPSGCACNREDDEEEESVLEIP